jgi:uncharacterized protein YdbL (DUF1318 family)
MRTTARSCACALAAAALLLCCGCNLFSGLVGTEIEIKGAQRSLEEEVLGSYDHVGEEVYLLAGVRSIDPVTAVPTPPRPTTASEARALAARRRMEFNRDDVAAFQLQGLVGEGNDGLLVVFGEAMVDIQAADPRRFKLVHDVASEENEDRRVLMQRIVDTNPELRGQEGLGAVGRILAAKYRQDAEAGTKLQLLDGTWVTKEAR